MTPITIMILLLILYWQLPALIKKKQYKELAVFLLLWIMAAVYSLASALGFDIFNPIRLIINLFDNLELELLYSLTFSSIYK